MREGNAGRAGPGAGCRAGASGGPHPAPGLSALRTCFSEDRARRARATSPGARGKGAGDGRGLRTASPAKAARPAPCGKPGAGGQCAGAEVAESKGFPPEFLDAHQLQRGGVLAS